jgi:hypothetical protein
MPSPYCNGFRTNLSFEQIAVRLTTWPDLEWSPWTQPDGPFSFHVNGYTAVPTPAVIEICSDPGPNQSNRFALKISHTVLDPVAAANGYFQMREKIHELLEATLIVKAVEEEIRATLDAERDILNLDSQNLRAVPGSIRVLHKHLKVLCLGRNRLTALPGEIAELTELTELEISESRLKELPPGIGSLKNLRMLDLSGNRLSTLPAEIGGLTHLRTLNLDRNRLELLPREIGNLKHLRKLNIEDNRLTHLPREFLNLSSLEDFDLDKWKVGPKKGLPPSNIRALIAGDNPWVYPPPETIRRGVKAIREYLTANPDPAHAARRVPHVYTVHVDDSYHRMNQTMRSKLGEFSDGETAIAACRKVVDEFFLKLSPGKTAIELFSDFKSFGEDPFLKTTDESCRFDAWEYAELRAKVIAAANAPAAPRTEAATPPSQKPIFALKSTLQVSQSFKVNMASRIREAIAELTWKMETTPDGLRHQITGERRDPGHVTAVTIKNLESSEPHEPCIYVSANSTDEADPQLKALFQRVQAAIFNKPGA